MIAPPLSHGFRSPAANCTRGYIPRPRWGRTRARGRNLRFSRRTRELHTEDGYSIATRFTGRPDLKVGQYVLQSKERVAQPHDRRIPEAVQRAVYERDNNTCRVCSWNLDRWSNDDPRMLELHHLQHHEDRGANIESNLIVICSKCHDEVHAGKHSPLLRKMSQVT